MRAWHCLACNLRLDAVDATSLITALKIQKPCPKLGLMQDFFVKTKKKVDGFLLRERKWTLVQGSKIQLHQLRYKLKVPSNLKRAKIIPISKDEDNSLPENHRPIPLLSIYNRIFEKLMQSRHIKFAKIATFYDEQYGFAVNTVLSMLYLILLAQFSKIWTTVNFSFGVFIDFKKAFDTVNHEILLNLKIMVLEV